MDWLSQFLATLGPNAAGAAEGMGGAAGAAGASPTDFGDSGAGMAPAPVNPMAPPMSPTPGTYPPVPGLAPGLPTSMIGGAPSATTGQVGPAGGMAESGGLPSLGASLQGPGPGGAPAGAPAPGANPLLAALRGVQAPPRPDVVKPSTPALPHQGNIQSGNLMALLQSLGYPRGAGPRPTTLGQTVGIGRY